MTRDINLLSVAALFLAGCVPQPAPKIIHLRNYHYVSREDFAADLRSQSSEPIDEADLDRQYAEFLDNVERVQHEQAATLRSLIREHGIRQVFVEGVTAANVEAFRDKVLELRQIDFDALHQRLADENLEFADQALLLVEIETRRVHRLELGAVGQLMMAGDAIDVAPLDDAKRLAAADPTKNSFRFDGPENDAREAEIVRRLTKAGPLAVAILGGAHDLSDDLPAGWKLEVITPKAWGNANE